MTGKPLRPESRRTRLRGRIAGFLLLSLTLAACGSLPEIRPSALPGQADIRELCRSFFPDGPHALTHVIEARLPDESRMSAMGVVLVDPSRQMIHSVIMTVEGFVLFDARHQGELTVHRAVGPFASPDFAEGIMVDVRMVFLPPPGRLTAAGLLENGFPVCRYEDDTGRVRDVLAGRDFAWAVHQYGGSHSLSHRVGAYSRNAAGFPERIEISRHDFPHYGLRLTLLQAERIPADDARLRP
ncbi:MAG: hypothetical protein A4E68_00520 [Syntrophaceae bacterium PtaB.Bin095]|nr:MAG: hypothetical protein A4E68_00520 [Syntrophaceae bacterium PtaB.Bin095]